MMSMNRPRGRYVIEARGRLGDWYSYGARSGAGLQLRTGGADAGAGARSPKGPVNVCRHG